MTREDRVFVKAVNLIAQAFEEQGLTDMSSKEASKYQKLAEEIVGNFEEKKS